MSKTVSVSDIRKEAQKLIESGKMPPLHQVLGAVAHARNQYAGRIKAAQASGPEPEEGAPVDFGGRVFPNPNGVKPELDTDHVLERQAPVTPHNPHVGSVDNAPPTDTKTFPAPEEVER